MASSLHKPEGVERQTSLHMKKAGKRLQQMVTNGKKWHCLEVKSLSRLLRRITLNNMDDYYCKNCLYSFRTESKLKLHVKIMIIVT